MMRAERGIEIAEDADANRLFHPAILTEGLAAGSCHCGTP